MMTNKSENIVGRGNRDGAVLFRQWFDKITQTAENNQNAAYVFVMGSISEVLRTFDFTMIFPEINSLQTAIRKVSDEYLDEAEDQGYSPDICGYVKADVAVQLRGGEHPMGRIPKPTIGVLTNACNTYIKWAEIWERMYQIPVFTIDVPGSREAGSLQPQVEPNYKNDLRYVEVQLQELISKCEEITGIKFDPDRLREILGYSNEMSRGWKKVLELNSNRPSLFNALTDGTVYLGVANCFRGTEEGANFFNDLVEEMEYKSAHGIGTLIDEKYRLGFVGVPCYPIFRNFNEFFTDWGGTFVNSTYLWFASGGTNRGFEYDLAKPIESLAEGILLNVRGAMDSMFFHENALIDMIDNQFVDGMVFHPIKSCRTVSTGLADSRRSLMTKRDIPSLFIESDMMDKRVVSEAQLKNRIDAFFEGLAVRKQRESITA